MARNDLAVIPESVTQNLPFYNTPRFFAEKRKIQGLRSKATRSIRNVCEQSPNERNAEFALLRGETPYLRRKT